MDLAGLRRAIQTARESFADPGNQVYLSAVSSWEIAVKHALGRLSLPGPPGAWAPSRRKAHGIEPLPLEEEAALHVARLPRLHADPFDRMLICQSIVHGMPFLRPDPAIACYAVRTIW